ncbi:fimbrillin family protein [Segatella paludivivens]|uniref:fimbrillin family protein n=1 Tax=Segatella paludivivens TaxID=185294 RepID=UPI0003A56A69|nr:fimbrillin family protein [Segatella paludivivens]
MKKILFFTVAAATVMALTGCSQSSDLTETAETSQTAISFDTYLAKTRAGASGSETTETLKTNGFGVLAYYTAQENYVSNKFIPDFMYNTKVTGTTTSWEYSPVRYWPNTNGDKISFFAYAPYVDVTSNSGTAKDQSTTGITAISSNNVNETPKVSYTLADTKTQSVDLLWGVKKGTVSDLNKDLTRIQANISGIGFTFKHALAVCDGNGLQAKVATDDPTFDPSKTKITIEEINIQSNTIATSGKFDLTTGTWEITKQDGSMVFDFKKENINTNFAEPQGSLMNNVDNLSKLSGLTTTAQNVLLDNTKSCYFIPGSTSSKATVTITYWVRTLDPSLSNGCTNVKQIITKEIQLPVFAANKKYALVLNIGINTVKFTAEVSDWSTDNSTPITTTVDVPEVI